MKQNPTRRSLTRAHGLLKSASEIIFLGFGFHQRNVERLKLDENIKFYAYANSKESRILACRTGMGAGDIMRVRNYLPASVEYAPDESWDISKFLSNTQWLNTYLPSRDPPHHPVKVVT